ncbi:hypothetical protein ACHAXH_001319 [Discostella pseudostelligera]
MQQDRDSSLPNMQFVLSSSSSMQRKYIEQSVQILQSLACTIVSMLDIGCGGEKQAALFNSEFIDIDNISIVCDPNSAMLGSLKDADDCGGPKILSATFITTSSGKDSPPILRHAEQEVNKEDEQSKAQTVKYVAMHAFARIAYEMCMMGNGPSLPEVTLQNTAGTSSATANIFPSLDESSAAPDGGAEDEEDEILDMMRKTYRASTESDVNNNNHYRKFLSAMVDASVPFPMRRFISDLLSDENGGIFRSDHSFASFEDVLSDLTQMSNNPDVFLHGSNPDRWKLVFGDKLYGRDVEMEVLTNAADRVINIVGNDDDSSIGRVAKSKWNKTEVVMVCGSPGAGKSRLVRLGGAQLEKRGWRLLQCKFDRVVHSEPLSILTHAFDDYFEQHVCCPKQGIRRCGADDDQPYLCGCHKLHTRIRRFIRPDGLEILALHIPSLRNIMGVALPVEMPDINTAIMTELFSNLLKAISSEESPVFFFIDDLQWADPLSLALIVAVIGGTHSETIQLSSADVCNQNNINSTDDPEYDPYIMFVGTYRANSVDDNPPLAKALNKLQCDDSIHMTNVTLSGITIEALHDMLSDCLCMPTRRVKSLSELVVQKTGGLPLYVIEFLRALITDNLLTHGLTRGWEWDEDSIDIFPITESVAELFALKLRRLPKDILLGLQIVSIFGTQVDQQIVDLVKNYDGEDSVDLSAALNVAQIEGLIERAANFISFAHDLIQKATVDSICEDDRVPLLRKLISALIKEASATNSLDSVLFVVVDLINRIGCNLISCQRERALFAELNWRAASKAIAVPDFAGAATYCESGISFLSETCWETLYDLSLRLYETAVLAHFSNNTDDRSKLMAYIHMIFDRAKDFSDKFNTHRVWTQVLSMKQLPVAIAQCLVALENLGEPLDLSSIFRRIASVKAFNRHQQEESDDDNVITHSVLSSEQIVSGCCRDIDGGNTWGRKAIDLMKVCGKPSLIPTVSASLHGFVFVWKEPFQSSLDFLAEGIRSSFVYGQVEYAKVFTQIYTSSDAVNQFTLLPMSNILRDLHEHEDHSTMERRRFEGFHHVDNYDLLKVAIEEGNSSQLYTIITLQTAKELMCRNMDKALKCTDLYFEHFGSKHLQMAYIYIFNVFYDGLINFHFAGRTGDGRYRERGENALSQLRDWLRHSDWNFQNKFLLLNAEHYKITNDFINAATYYNESINAAKQHKFIHEEAMANELAGIFYSEQGIYPQSLSYFKQAVECYRKWGASVIARELEIRIEEQFGKESMYTTGPIDAVVVPNVASQLCGKASTKRQCSY